MAPSAAPATTATSPPRRNSRPSFLWSPVVSQVSATRCGSGGGAAGAASGRVSVIVMCFPASGTWARSPYCERSPAQVEELVEGHGPEQQGDVGDRVGEQAHRLGSRFVPLEDQRPVQE